jgi:glucokinase
MTVLLADIGGTHARFARADGRGIHDAQVFRAADYPSLAAAARAYLQKSGPAPARAVFSVAATLDGTGRIAFVNHPAWDTDRAALCRDLDIDDIRLLNDFEALAHAVPHLAPDALHTLQENPPVNDGPVALLGPGTGLGMAVLVSIGGKRHVLPSAGGNASLAAAAPAEARIAERVRQDAGLTHLSTEDVISGPGLLRLYGAIAALDGMPATLADAAAVARAGTEGRDAAAVQALDFFCHGLGVAAGNLALTVQATGGVYIAGGIVPQMLAHFAKSRFLAGFTGKGPYTDYLRALPVHVITHPFPAFEGLRAAAGLIR